MDTDTDMNTDMDINGIFKSTLKKSGKMTFILSSIFLLSNRKQFLQKKIRIENLAKP
jgi:hypothetical protein